MGATMDKDQFLQYLLGIVSGGAYLYRGESQEYPYVSSGLWRSLEQPHQVLSERSHWRSVREVQRDVLRKVQSTTGDQDPIRVLTEMQHYGGKTNLIDFTRDINIALFFSCVSDDNKHGRVVLLPNHIGSEAGAADYTIVDPTSPKHMISAQRSVFVEPANGILSESSVLFVRVRRELKRGILRHLREVHGISLESVFNDLSAFTRDPLLMLDEETLYQSGVLAFFTGNYEKVITTLTAAFSKGGENFMSCHIYFHRGLSYWQLGRSDEAIDDLRHFIRGWMPDKEHFIEEVKGALLQMFLSNCMK